MSNDLFDASNTDHSDADETTDYLSEYVGEGKKFADPAALARGKFESDRFITKLQAENAEMREELQKVSRLQDMIDRLSKLEKPAAGSDNHDDDQSRKAPEVDIEKLIEEKLTRRESERTAQQNIAEAKKLLQEKFGNSFGDKLTQKANELGISRDEMTALAARSPKALIALVAPQNGSGTASLFAPPAGSGTGSGFTPGTPDRTAKYYDNLKKTDSAKYWQASTQMQMHKDAIRLGEKFFDN